MRILILGAGVIGSVYAGRLLQAGHDVVLLARGDRLVDLAQHGLILEDAETGQRDVLPVTAVEAPQPATRYDLVIVPVRAGQLTETLPVLSGMTDDSDVLFFGNTAGLSTVLVDRLGHRALFGFPAVGGVRDGPVIRSVLIRQQQTMLGEARGAPSERVRALQAMLRHAGFPTTVSSDIDRWLLGHAAFVVPIAFALYRVGTDSTRLAADRATVRMMVRATSQAFRALAGSAEIPPNLRSLYRLPTVAIVRYWRRVFAGPRGELWFAAHSRAAPEEMRAMAVELIGALARTGQRAPDLEALLE